MTIKQRAITAFGSGLSIDRFDEELTAAGWPADGITDDGATVSVEFPDLATPSDATLDALVASHGGTVVPPLRIDALAGEAYRDVRGLDYKTGLIGRLHRHNDATNPSHWYRGEIRCVDWYDTPAQANLILRVEITYARQPNGLLTLANPAAVWGDADFFGRRTVRTWYRTDGTAHPVQKISDKTYNAVEAMSEGERRRKNVVQQLSLDLLTMLVVTETAANPAAPTAAEIAAAEAIGVAYIAKYENDIAVYYTTGYLNWTGAAAHTPHPTPNITTDAESWLDNDLALLGLPGVTIRDVLLGALKGINE